MTDEYALDRRAIVEVVGTTVGATSTGSPSSVLASAAATPSARTSTPPTEIGRSFLRPALVSYGVQLPGHVGLALVFTAPAWLALPRGAAATFIALALPASMLPDVDLVLPGVGHHGVTHTFLFVVVASVALGAIVVGLDELLRDDGPPRGVRRSVLAFSAAAFFVGAGSHLLADMLSAPDVAQPIEPFWPLWQGTFGLDVLYFSSPVSNFGLLVVGVAAHLVVLAAIRRRRSATPA